MSESFERRKYKRCKVKVPISLAGDSSSLKTFSVDLSLGGACVHSGKSLPLNSKVYMTLTFPDEERESVDEMKVIAYIVRVEEISSGNCVAALGVKFQNISESDIAMLKEYLHNQQKPKKEAWTRVCDEVPEDDPDDAEEEIVVDGLNAEIAPYDNAEMGFFERMQHREDGDEWYVRLVKNAGKLMIAVLLLYIFYYISLLVWKLVFMA